MKHQSGFSLLESMLAITVVVIASVGVYSLFQSGRDSYHLNDASQEMIEIANVFTDLASADLTNGMTKDTIVATLYNSHRLPNRYFADEGGSVVNPFGTFYFSSASAYSFVVDVPLGCTEVGSTLPKDFFNTIKDVYRCGFGTQTYENYNDACLAVKTGSCNTAITLNFNLSG